MYNVNTKLMLSENDQEELCQMEVAEEIGIGLHRPACISLRVWVMLHFA